MRRKLSLDLVMTALILLSFAYQLTGNSVHELLGFFLFALFLIHNLAVNRTWYSTLPKGKYRPRRIVGMAVNLPLLGVSLMMLLSGTVNSHLIAEWLSLEGDTLPRELHTTAAYWFLVLMSIHLGMHWRLIMAETRRFFRLSQATGIRLVLLRLCAVIVSGYGTCAAVERNLFAKLVAYFSFDYWDFGQSVLGYFGQYLAIVSGFAFLAHYGLNWRQGRCSNQHRSTSRVAR